MKIRSAAFLAVAGWLALSRVAIAAETFVACPAPQLEAGVTTPLPQGWWATPQQGGLINTEVALIAGKQRLVCNYQVFGTKVPVMSAMPPGLTSCKPTNGGFSCAGKSTGKAGSAGNDQGGKPQSSSASKGDKGQKGSTSYATQGTAPAAVVSQGADPYAVGSGDGTDSGYENASGYEDASGYSEPGAQVDASGYEASSQGSGQSGAAAAGAMTAGGLIDKDAARRQVENFIKDGVQGDKNKKRGPPPICPDPAAIAIAVKPGSVTVTPGKVPTDTLYNFQLEGEVKNVMSYDFISTSYPQTVEIYQLSPHSKERRIASLPLDSLAAGQSVYLSASVVKWSISAKSIPNYELRISFDPNSLADGDAANDDCTVKNNNATIRGSDINSALLAGN
jgi:hypothetical protein